MPAFGIEVPGDRAHGDLSANVAMVSARAFKRAPRQIADCIAAHLMLKGTYLEKAEVAGPGFLNFFLSPAFYADVVADVLDKREAYGRSDYGHGKKVMVEFVSANPTGPMHMGNARGGALGDCLAAVLEAVPDDAVPDADEPALCDGEQPARPTAARPAAPRPAPFRKLRRVKPWVFSM